MVTFSPMVMLVNLQVCQCNLLAMGIIITITDAPRLSAPQVMGSYLSLSYNVLQD